MRVSSSIPEPSRGWGGINGSSVGKVKKIAGLKDQEEVTVDFPQCKKWVALATEVELVREPNKGDKVQVNMLIQQWVAQDITGHRINYFTRHRNKPELGNNTLVDSRHVQCSNCTGEYFHSKGNSNVGNYLLHAEEITDNFTYWVCEIISYFTLFADKFTTLHMKFT